MDQSTQVNFPILPKNQHRKMWRHNTSADLYDRPDRALALNNSWSQLKPLSQRPKSLNLTTEAFNRRLTYIDSPISRLSPPALVDLPMGSISRERTPPFSCNSSVTSHTGIGSYKTSLPYNIPAKLKIRDDESSGSGSGSKYCCKCYDIESGKSGDRAFFTTTKDGLSWRRLHMSRAKLKATATASELLSGFAMIAMVELQIPPNVPKWLTAMFAVCTTVLVAVHIFALMISTYILPNIEAIAKLEVCEMVTESPHERMKGFIEIAWAFSTVLGLFLFLIEIAILCWVKFWDDSFPAAIAATVIVIPVLITFVLFAAHFYHSLVVYKCNTSTSDMEKLENIKKQLDEVSVGV